MAVDSGTRLQHPQPVPALYPDTLVTRMLRKLPPLRRSIRRRILRGMGRFMLVLVGTAIGLSTVEAFIRMRGLAPELGVLNVSIGDLEFVSSDDPYLRYVPRIGAKDVNQLGHRDSERAVEKAPGVRRVVVLGDSVAYGFCDSNRSIPVDRVFPYRLDARLGSPVEVLNLSVSGYNTEQEVQRLFLDGLQLAPDIVLVAATANDDRDASLELDHLARDAHWELDQAIRWALGDAWLGSSHLLRYGLALRLAREPRVTPEGGGYVERGLVRLAGLASEHGFSVAVAMFPTPGQPANEPTSALFQRISTDQGFAFWNLRERLDGHPEYYRPCNAMHLNERGHGVAAEWLDPKIRALIEGLDAR